MIKFRAKQIVVEACQFTGWSDDGDPIFEDDPTGWLLDAMNADVVKWYDDQKLFVATEEGDLTVDVGDWIVRGVTKEIHPCKPDIFALSYEPA